MGEAGRTGAGEEEKQTLLQTLLLHQAQGTQAKCVPTPAAGSWVARRRAAEEAARRGEQSGQAQAKKKRKRKVRYPKGYDPANPGPLPNPERWLPKWQRSDFKKKRKTRKDKEKQVGHLRAAHKSMCAYNSAACRAKRPNTHQQEDIHACACGALSRGWELIGKW